MATILPLAGAELIIDPDDNGYKISLRKPSGAVCDVMDLYAKTRNICGTKMVTYYAGIHMDYDSPNLIYDLSLLDPDFRPSVCQLPDGRLYCRSCHCIVPNTANAEMRKENCYAHSHICGIQADDEIYLTNEQAAQIEKGD